MIRIAALFLFLVPTSSFAQEGICSPDYEFCRSLGITRNTSPATTTSSRVQVNPSAVPTDKMFGIEVIGYKGEGDIGIVRGLGRVGAAVTPSNSEETFFGAPSAETPIQYEERKILANKYKQQKYTLATGFNLYEKRGGGLRNFSLNLGVMGKYNSVTKATTPGGGISGVFGPFTLGYSALRDETAAENYDPANPQKVQSIVETYSIGFYLTSLVLDYTTIRVQNTDVLYSDMITGTLFYKKFIFTVAKRLETSSRPGFNFKSKTLESELEKTDWFYGAQYKVHKNFLVGGLYNYYLLREISLTASVIF